MEYLKYLDSAKNEPVNISEASKSDLIKWQKEVQPTEQSQASKWNWALSLNILYEQSKAFGQEPKFIKIENKDKELIGMMLIVNNIKAFDILGRKESSSFLWFIQTGNKDYLNNKNIDKSKYDISIGKALIDTAIFEAYSKNQKLKLHADPKSEINLNEFYEKQGFKNIPMKIKRISLTRQNDGNYFEMKTDKQKIILKENRTLINQEFKAINHIKKSHKI